MSDNLIALPVQEDRWHPTRAGLVSVWRYWDETFTFHRGRLLLRGPNGSGKSLALELLLPFLFDADASPTRLTSATKSRGGLYDRLMTGTDEPTRTGFVWLELRRGGQVFTVGARIRASQATRRADVDYFTTRLGVGRELHLLDAHRVPISRQALVEALGDSGRVHSSAEEHRAAVREELFPGFGPDRYSSLIGALLTLRKEKLSQQLTNVDDLSKVLSESLPPLDDRDLAAVAEGFERLDRRRRELKDLEAELGEVRQLTDRQRHYARAVVVSGASAVRSAETKRDDVTKEERRAGEELRQAVDAAKQTSVELESLDNRLGAIGVEVEALKDSDAYRDGASLADLRKQAGQLASIADRDRKRCDAAAAALEAAAQEREQAADGFSTAAANRERAEREARAVAWRVGAEPVIDQAGQVDSIDEADGLVRAWLGAQRTRIREVRAALDEQERAVTRRTFHETELEKAEEAAAGRGRDHQGALGDLAGATDRYRVSVEAWAARCETLGPDRLRAVLPASPDDPDAVGASVAGLSSELESEQAVARRDLQAEQDTVEAQRQQLDEERQRWEAAVQPDPPAPAWRSDRAALPGAPLWKLVDPATDLAAEAVDRLEAALTGAGLLDAWVHPDGSVRLPDGRADVVLTARPTGHQSLASVLSAASEDPGRPTVPARVVRDVLASIPLASSALAPPEQISGPEVVIGLDGTYRVGNAAGRGPGRPASLLGAAARERHRRARLTELATALAETDGRLAELEVRRISIDRRAAAVRAELADAPTSDHLVEARRSAEAAAVRLGEARARVDSTRSDCRQAEEAVRTALRELTSLCSRHGLPSDRSGLAEAESGLGLLETVLSTWTRRRGDERGASRLLARSSEAETRARDAVEKARAEQVLSTRDADLLAERAAALESTIGAEYSQLLDRLQDLEKERTDRRRRSEELRPQLSDLQRRVGSLEMIVESAAQARQRAETLRDLAHRRMVGIIDHLGADAGILPPGALDGASAILAFARAVAVEHEGVKAEPEVIERLSDRVREQMHQAKTALGARIDLDRELIGDQSEPGPFTPEQWWVLRTMAGGVRRPVGALCSALAAELEAGRAELAAEEEKLFEQTLAGSVRRALADRIRQANRLVQGINAQLAAIRTAASSVQVSLQWGVDPEQLDAVKAARSLLLRDPADLSDPERTALQDFVRARVDQARAELEGNAPWEARLRETLDYRRWHRFTLHIGHRDWNGFQPATPSRLQKLSTGERSIALHLPMIASVAAHYAGEADRLSVCPRLILLDELFAGVDSANRSQLFGTLTAWDLDAVFTSDHEWCQYSTLDGIAIHHLHPGEANEPVTSTRFTWDGHQRRIDADPSAA